MVRLYGRLFVLVLVLVALWLDDFLVAAQGETGRSSRSGHQFLVYVGTYTRGASRGIYAYRFEPSTGHVVELGLGAEMVNPSFLALHPNRRFLYAVSEVDDYDSLKSGSVSAFVIDPQTGQLKLLNRVSSQGGWPCHLSLDGRGRMLAVANYADGRVAAFPVRTDGSLGALSSLHQHRGSSVDPRRQQGPHAHSIDFSPDNRMAVSADLGTDQLLLYRADPDRASLEPADPPSVRLNPGAGPRHFAFHPSGRFGYVINEMQSTITSYQVDSRQGGSKEIETLSTLPGYYKGRNFTAEIAIHPSGAFLYGSNRGHDSLAVFAIDRQSGRLTLIEHTSTGGQNPRHFALDPSASYLWAANQNTNNIVLFQVDTAKGTLKATGEELSLDSPVCIIFVPVG